MKKTLILAAFATAVLLASCSRHPERIELIVNGEPCSIDLSSDRAVDLTTLSTEFAAEVTVADYQSFDRLSVGGVPLTEGKAKVPVDVIGKDAYLALDWGCGKAGGTVLLRTLPADVPDFIASGRSDSPGDYYLSFVYLRLILKYDNAGNIVFYRYEPHQIADENDSSGWWDFKKHKVGTETYYSYHAPDSAFADRIFLGFNPGKRVLLDYRYRPIGEIHLLADEKGRVKKGDPVDGHDFYLFDLEHYIVAAYVERDGVYATYLQEVQDGMVVFDWWSTDHPELARWLDPAFTDKAEKDYVHFNSIDILPDGNWLCSLRHISSLVAIDRMGGTGNIIWRIAGAEMPGDLAFHGQHCARWHEGNGTISLFDNGNGTGVSRLLRLYVDPETGAVGGGANLLSANYPPYFSQACGALTFSGGHFIAGWGIPDPEGPKDRLLIEFDPAGNEVFSIRQSPQSPYPALFSSYRCVKQ